MHKMAADFVVCNRRIAAVHAALLLVGYAAFAGLGIEPATDSSRWEADVQSRSKHGYTRLIAIVENYDLRAPNRPLAL